MLSMSYKTTSDHFNRCLQSRLEFIEDRTREGEQNGQDRHETFLKWLEVRRRSDLLKFVPAPGTTFPPNRFGQLDHFKAKFHSESDLSPLNHLHEPVANRTLRSLKLGPTKATECSTQPMDIKSESMEAGDSDLFFDFDIGSPTDSDNEPSHLDQMRKRNGTDPEELSPFNREDQVRAELSRSCSTDNSDGGFSPSMSHQLHKTNRTFGSTSSGLCSDMDTLQSGSCDSSRPIDEDEDELTGEVSVANSRLDSLESNCSTPKIIHSPSKAGASPTTPEELKTLPVKCHDLSPCPRSASEEMFLLENDPPEDMSHIEENTDVERRDLGEEDENALKDFTIHTGEARHKVAHSKLNALIALLEKDREYSRNNSSSRSSSQSSLRSSKEGSPQKPSTSSPPMAPVGSSRKSFQSSLPTIAASPANFSFLSNTAAKHNRSMDDSSSEYAATTDDMINLGSSPSSKVIFRCDSTPVLSTFERSFMESPKLSRKIYIPKPKAEVVSEEVPEELNVDTDNTLDVAEPLERVRRASSLRSGKTPPGTPGRRKIVRFADVFGLDLADVKMFLDEVPRVPMSAYKDLRDVELSDIESDTGSNDGSSQYLRKTMQANFGPSKPGQPPLPLRLPSTSLVPMFNQPGGFANFFDLLNTKKVCLENAFMGHKAVIQGTIRVQNISFHKKVTIRFTMNEWISSADCEAVYMNGSCDGFSDKFTFNLLPTTPPSVGQRIQFCIQYQTDVEEYWDNNDGKNYVFQCIGVAGETAQEPRSMSSAISFSSPRPQEHSYGSGSGYSQSPSAMAEDPWLRYL
eukprot:maker-scaffold577_size191314-snap-gene-0.36 protein:Tk12276 transcript:maker-scaffold577_size191314-snap-gene-0.36-mRNA-1 annotation:"PREDICTED: uncharacterized protein LOC100878232"